MFNNANQGTLHNSQNNWSAEICSINKIDSPKSIPIESGRDKQTYSKHNPSVISNNMNWLSPSACINSLNSDTLFQSGNQKSSSNSATTNTNPSLTTSYNKNIDQNLRIPSPESAYKTTIESNDSNTTCQILF